MRKEDPKPEHKQVEAPVEHHSFGGEPVPVKPDPKPEHKQVKGPS
jgi:hypothetical protein